MNDTSLSPMGNVDLVNLSEAELEIVVQVIQKDFELKAAEKARLRRHRRQLKDYDKRVSILASSDFNAKFCVICFQRFFIIIVPKRSCFSCRHFMCNGCSVWIPMLKAYICLLCQKERNLKSMGCDWYYGLLKHRFQQDGSELVAQSLYKSQGQYSIITPDLLKRVKGAQITRYREKINAKWEEMQKRLRQLDQSQIHKSKKDEAWQYLTEEYKTHFREILKEFSQFLYVTLENYAAKIDDPTLDINEQVISTVYDEVELMIGYRLNYVPDEIGSVLSDVESTASMFIGNQMEEKLAGALVNKILQDHSLNEMQPYDVKCLENFPIDASFDHSSTISYVYRARPYSTNLLNGTISGRSSAEASSLLDTEQSIEPYQHISEYGVPSQEYQPRDSVSTIEDGNENDEIVLSADQIQNIMRNWNFGRRSSKQIIKRCIKVPFGEPLKLEFHLNDVSDIDVTWTKTVMSRTVPLTPSKDVEISETSTNNFKSFYLKIWDSKATDIGVYTGLISSQPIVEFTVNLVENVNSFKKPSYRLKMLNSNCRSGQTAEFSVEADGYPEPRIAFYSNDKIIEIPSKKYRIDFKDQISRYILKISGVTENDHGTYKCVASNAAGSCECSAQLLVTNVQFRFDTLPNDKSIRYYSTSNSSIEDDVARFPPTRSYSKPDTPNNVFENSDGALSELVEIHQHLMYLEWQLDWFEEQTSPDALKSPNSLKTANSVNTEMSQHTVIGREIPDEVTENDNQKYNRIRRPVNHSYSTENIDLVDCNLARKEAIKSSGHSLNTSNSNISKLKEVFEPNGTTTFHRNSSITGRTPRPHMQRALSPFTKEVRVLKTNTSNQ